MFFFRKSPVFPRAWKTGKESKRKEMRERCENITEQKFQKSFLWNFEKKNKLIAYYTVISVATRLQVTTGRGQSRGTMREWVLIKGVLIG